MPTTLHLRLLGGFEARVLDPTGAPTRDASASELPSAKTQALLAYLACVRRRHSRDTLAEMFWGDSDEEAAKTSLRQALTALRKSFDPWLLIERDSVAFHTAAYALDVEAFERGAHGDLNARRAALGLYSGELLKGFVVRNAPGFDEWLVVERERLRHLAAGLLRQVSEAEALAGDFGAAAERLRALVAHDPLDESAHRQLMLFLARSGQRAAGLAQFEACKTVLQRELGVAPEPQTRRLADRIRMAMSGVGGNIDRYADDGPLVDREAELAEVRRMLLDPHCRLLTLTGMGGTGKTRLGLAAARACVPWFLNGVVFVPAGAAESLGAVLDAIAAALRFVFGRGDPQTQLVEVLREKELLLVLDGLDRLAGDDATGAFLSRLLRDAPELKILVASRERLRLQSEWLYEVKGLSEGGARALFARIARRVMIDLDPDGPARADIDRVCGRVGRLPLGIALAAPLARLMSCAEIATALERGYGILASSARDAPERHASLEAAFNESWARLDAPERRSLVALSVFPADFSVEAGAAVGDASRQIVAGLADKSLLQSAVAGRFELHELVRQFARARLAPAEAALASQRHCAWYAAFLARREPQLRGRMQKDAADAIRAETENLRQMWAWAVGHGDVDALGKACRGFFWLWDTRGWYAEIDRLFEEAAERAAGAPRIRAQLMARRATALNRIGRFADAGALLVEAESLAAAAGDFGTQALATRHRCYGPLVQGDFERARDFIARSLELYRQAGDLAGAGDALIGLGIVDSNLGRYDEARRHHQEAADILEELGDEQVRAIAIGDIGNVDYFTGRLEDARRRFRQAIDIQRNYDDRRGMAINLNNTACVSLELGDWNDAIEMSRECIAAFGDMGMREGVMHSAHNLAVAALGLGELGQAQAQLDSTLDLALGLDATPDGLEFLVTGARLLKARGEKARAARVLAGVARHPAAMARSREAAEHELATLAAAPDAGPEAPSFQELVALCRA
jgi:DNA-binding SARP family transcriptional activator/predicted ATPase